MRRFSLGVIAAVAACSCVVVCGCGLQVQSPDLFLLTRTMNGKTLTMLVNDSGTIACNGGKAKNLSDTLLIQARDLASNLDKDAKANLRIPRAPNSVAMYTVQLMNGTISFPDTAADSRHVLSEVELFAVQAGQQACGID